MEDKQSAIWNKTQFGTPHLIGDENKTFEEITIFPVINFNENESFINVVKTSEMSISQIVISHNGQMWEGTMEELIKKLVK